MPMKSTLTVLSAILALGLAAAAHGATAQSADTTSVKVSFRDLNLNSEAGARTMLRRIRNAAGTICGAEPTDPFQRMQSYAPCVSGITDLAVADLHSSMVSSLNGKTQTLASAR